jgi:ABC-type Na+ transport system ATPase subunit NatA/DNA-binding transcriptional regulator YhcF (GntR family)
MGLHINFKSGKPVYLQIVDQVKSMSASGALRAGEALPSIRPLAEELRLNRNTVAKAYAELESLGVIETVPGRGCFLKSSQSPLRKEVRRKLLIEEIDQVMLQPTTFKSRQGIHRHDPRTDGSGQKDEKPANMSPVPAIQIENLKYAYGRAEAVHDISLTVQPGRCYGLLGRNGAGKTTTMKCLLNLLRPRGGMVRVFGLDPAKQEVEVKRRLAYVPDQVAFYPWMSIRETLDYLASFRTNWNRRIEADLIERFRLDPTVRTDSLSKGQRTQVALIAAICPETDLLVLDEPTSGLDPIVGENSLKPSSARIRKVILEIVRSWCRRT